MKKVGKVLGLVLAASCVMGMATGCNESTQEIGKDFVAATSQLDALTKLDQGAADVAVIDSVMAGYYMTTGEYAATMQMVENLVLAEESYGIAGRKEDKAFVSKINEALIALRTSDYSTLTNKYGLTASAALTEATENPYAAATDNSWTEIQTEGKFIVGDTIFAPIAYEDDTKANGLTGFDIELAEAVADYLNLEVEFKEIDWNAKESLLENGTIDLIWNGMTITDERAANMCISVPYLFNKQVAVIKKADASKYTTKESMKDAIMTAESGSAGETIIKGEKEE